MIKDLILALEQAYASLAGHDVGRSEAEASAMSVLRHVQKNIAVALDRPQVKGILPQAGKSRQVSPPHQAKTHSEQPPPVQKRPRRRLSSWHIRRTAPVPPMPLPASRAPAHLLLQGSEQFGQFANGSIVEFRTIVSMTAKLMDQTSRQVAIAQTRTRGSQKAKDHGCASWEEAERYVRDTLLVGCPEEHVTKTVALMAFCVQLARTHPKIPRRDLVVPGYGLEKGTFFAWFIEGLSIEGAWRGNAEFEQASRRALLLDPPVLSKKSRDPDAPSPESSSDTPNLEPAISSAERLHPGLDPNVSIVDHQTIVSIAARLMDSIKAGNHLQHDHKANRARLKTVDVQRIEDEKYIRDHLLHGAKPATLSKYLSLLNFGAKLAQDNLRLDRRRLVEPGYGRRLNTTFGWFVEGLAAEGDLARESRLDAECRSVFCNVFKGPSLVKLSNPTADGSQKGSNLSVGGPGKSL